MKDGTVAASASVDPASSHRTLGAIAIAAITFSLVCGSPVGIEGAVGAGGAFGFALMLVFGMAVWAIPQALIVAELSTAFPGPHGGSVLWVERGLGGILGFVNAAIVQVCNRHAIDWAILPFFTDCILLFTSAGFCIEPLSISSACIWCAEDTQGGVGARLC